jgi:hypothetical protein
MPRVARRGPASARRPDRRADLEVTAVRLGNASGQGASFGKSIDPPSNKSICENKPRPFVPVRPDGNDIDAACPAGGERRALSEPA